MSQAECPKCGWPRQAEAAECPSCGIIFARFRGGPAPPPLPPEAAAPPVYAAAHGELYVETEPAAPSPTAGLPEIYGGPPVEEGVYQPAPPGATAAVGSRYGGGAGAGDHPVEHVETPFTRNLGLALLVCGLLALFAQGFWSQEMLNATASTREARDRFLTVTGFEAPAELDDGGALRFAGRDFVWLFHGDAPENEPSLLAGAFSPGSLAGDMDRTELLDALERLWSRSGVPLDVIGSREQAIGGNSTLSRTYSLGGANSPVRAFSLAIETPSGEHSVLFLLGPAGEVAAEARRMVL